jgi:thiol-disulfide isomerase/thioredoxin
MPLLIVLATMLASPAVAVTTSSVGARVSPGVPLTTETAHSRPGAAKSPGQAPTTSTRTIAPSASAAMASVTATLRGPYNLTVTVTRFDGSPAAGMPYAVEVRPPRGRGLTLLTGALDSTGMAFLEGLAGGEAAPVFRLSVSGEDAGSFRLPGPVTTRAMRVRLPPMPGDMAPDIELRDPTSSHTIRLSDLRGQVVLLDFWASWCGPCQKPMAENQEIAARHAGDWTGRATLLCASIDDDSSRAATHAARNGWTAPRILWCAPGGFDAPAPKAYGIRAIPKALLIGRDGRIVRRDHPAAIKVEEVIQGLLAAK